MTPDPKTPAKPRASRKRSAPTSAREIEAAAKKALVEQETAPEPITNEQAVAEILDDPIQQSPTPEAAFANGQTIAQIAVGLRKSHAQVRKLLDAAKVDYSADPNASATKPPAAGSAAPAEKTPKTPIGKLDAMIAKNHTGALKPRPAAFAAALQGDSEVAARIAAIGALHNDDQDAYGRALVSLSAFLWASYK